MSEKVNSADPSPENHDPSSYFYRVLKVNRKHLTFHLYKVLLSKLLYTEEIFTEEDEVLLFLAYERCVELCVDPSAEKKYYHLLSANRVIFNGLSEFVKDKESIRRHRESLEWSFSHGRSQLNAYIYYGAKVSLEVKMSTYYPRKPRAKNRIGVGYRDKGTAKNTAWDGSPSWQEVALDEFFRNQQEVTQSTRLDQLWQSLRVGDHWPWQKRSRRYSGSSLCRLMRG